MVKCADCGFLAGRDLESRELVEVTLEIRKTGLVPTHHSFPAEVYTAFPLCFAGAWPIDQEGKGTDAAERLKVIQRERECSSFTKWHFGSTPKEHQVMLIQQELLEWQRKRENEDREYRDQQRRLDLEHREQERRDDHEWKQKQEKHWRWELIIVGIIATFVLSAAQIIAGLIQAGYFRRWLGPP